jgi:lipoprotein signal peptidase
MKRALFALAGIAIALAAVDLAHKADAGPVHLHERSASYVFFALALMSAWTSALLATRSLSLAAAGGVVAGGAIGNLASVALWSGVPNPLVVEPFAFNLADVFVVSGFVLTALAMLAFAIRNRDRLREPV